jgi:hypothetical protein
MIKIHQIYFNEKSKRNCYPQWEHYDNSEKLTEYFENTVIVDLIRQGAHKDAEYFGVFSHDIKREMVYKEWIGENNKLAFSPAALEQCIRLYKDVEVFGFQRRRENPNIVKQAERYHPGFIKAMEHILSETGFLDAIPPQLNNIILFNHFVMRSEIYEQYVNELLIPAMEVMRGMPELFKDAKYKRIDEPTKARFLKAFGKGYFPYHPFICERLPSLFMEKYKYSFRQIF